MGLNQQIQGLWYSCHTKEGRLNEAQKAEEWARKELDEQAALMETMEEQAHKESDEQVALIKTMVRLNELCLYSELISLRKLK